MKNQFLQVVLDFCETYELQTTQAHEDAHFLWVFCSDPVKVSALLQSFLVIRFPSVCFDRHIYEEDNKSIINAKYNDFDICVMPESEVF